MCEILILWTTKYKIISQKNQMYLSPLHSNNDALYILSCPKKIYFISESCWYQRKRILHRYTFYVRWFQLIIETMSRSHTKVSQLVNFSCFIPLHSFLKLQHYYTLQRYQVILLLTYQRLMNWREVYVRIVIICSYNTADVGAQPMR